MHTTTVVEANKKKWRTHNTQWKKENWIKFECQISFSLSEASSCTLSLYLFAGPFFFLLILFVFGLLVGIRLFAFIRNTVVGFVLNTHTTSTSPSTISSILEWMGEWEREKERNHLNPMPKTSPVQNMCYFYASSRQIRICKLAIFPYPVHYAAHSHSVSNRDIVDAVHEKKRRENQ